MKRMLMRTMKAHLLTLLLLFSLAMANAQDVSRYEQKGLFKYFTEFEKAPALGSVESFIRQNYEASAAYGIKILNVETDDLGITHYRVQQTFNNVAIANSMLLLHVKDGKVLKANGEWYRQLPVDARKSAALSESTALSRALEHVNAQTYIWETEEARKVKEGRLANERNINYDKPEGELVYITTNNDLDASKLTLTYRFDVFAVEPYTEQNVYVDASSGKIVFEESLIHDALVNGTANTGYYGAKQITVDQSGSYYYARQTGNRNFQLYNNNSPYYSTSSTFSGTGNAKYYIDVYWGAEVTWDYYKEKFGRNGYDNAGSKINFVVNNPQVNNNAYWQNGTASFGNSSSGTPFTSLDVVAHEVTHGVTGTSAGLIYQGESGALNEAFSDIFGTYAEHYANVGDKWTVGEYISFQRSMSNPNRHRQPDTYRGTYWASTSGGDNGGVHTNSGVLNYWYYLTAEGGSGTNDNGNSFSVSGIGIEKAAQIAYRALTRYLTSSSGYSAARTAVINAARDLYGNGSCEEAAATDAMHAVGVGSAFSGNCGGGCDALTGLSVSQISNTSATVSWNAVSGVSSYTLEYKPSTSSTYTTLNVSTNSRTLTGLTAGTTYNVRARYTCSNGTTADYATTSFTTESDNTGCDAVTGLSVGSITQTSASVSWNGVSGVNSYTLEYKASSASSFTSVTVNGTSRSLSGLSAGTSYDVRVRYTCSNGDPSSYASTTFTTESDGGGGCDGLPAWSQSAYYNAGDQVVYNNKIYEALYNIYYWPPTSAYWREIGPCGGGGDCAAVTGLAASQVTSNSAQISWNAVSGVSSYNFGYKTSSQSTWTTETVSSNSEPFTGLSANTTYNVRINYTCSNGQTAPYATVTFTTESGDNGGGCSGVAPYQNGKTYYAGDRVVYQGYLYEAQIDGVYWPPYYGWWTNLGPCNGGYSAFGADEPIAEGLNLYPNPARGHVNIKIYSQRKAKAVRLRVVNSIGATVYHQDVELNEGVNDIRVNLKSVKPGVYILELDGTTRRLVVQE